MEAGERDGGPNPTACPQEPFLSISLLMTITVEGTGWGEKKGGGKGEIKKEGKREKDFKSSICSLEGYIDYFFPTPTNF